MFFKLLQENNSGILLESGGYLLLELEGPNEATGTGILALSGQSSASVSVESTLSGGLSIGGDSTAVFVGSPGAQAQGQLNLSGQGSADVDISTNVATSFGLSGDAGVEVRVEGQGSGSLNLSGDAEANETKTVTAEGTLSLSGSSEVDSNVTASGEGRLSFTGSSTIRVYIKPLFPTIIGIPKAEMIAIREPREKTIFVEPLRKTA